MTRHNVFADASIKTAGVVSGVDHGGHLMFRIDTTEGLALFGEYIEVFGGDGYDLSIEIGDFGFTDREIAGNHDPRAREHFSAEECASAQQLIQSYFSGPSVALKTWRSAPEIKFRGEVRFRPDWAICAPSDR